MQISCSSACATQPSLSGEPGSILCGQLESVPCQARGSSNGAGARQVAPRPAKLQSLQDRLKMLSGVLRNAVLEMMLQWASQAHRPPCTGMRLQVCKPREAVKRKPRKLDSAARVHAHIAFLFKNHQPDSVRDVSVFLASQVFVIMNSFKPEVKRASSSHLLGVGEFELFDVFERWRAPIAAWLRVHPKEAPIVMENIERVVTCKGIADITMPDANRIWREMQHEPANWASSPIHTESGQDKAIVRESYREWLQRTYHKVSEGSGAEIVVSVNQGRYHCRDAGLSLLPQHVLHCSNLLEATAVCFTLLHYNSLAVFSRLCACARLQARACQACGNMEHMQVVLREETLHRTRYELVGQNYEAPLQKAAASVVRHGLMLQVHCWDAERLNDEGLPEWLNTRSLKKVGDKAPWLAEARHPVAGRSGLRQQDGDVCPGTSLQSD